MKTLYSKDDMPLFLIKEVEVLPHVLVFEVYEVNKWNMDNTPTDDVELYLKGAVKWDGCANLNFGDEGYIHLCGKRSFDVHCEMIKKLYEYASKVITDFDKEVAE